MRERVSLGLGTHNSASREPATACSRRRLAAWNPFLSASHERARSLLYVLREWRGASLKKRTRNSASTKGPAFQRVSSRLANTRLILHRRSRRSPPVYGPNNAHPSRLQCVQAERLSRWKYLGLAAAPGSSAMPRNGHKDSEKEHRADHLDDGSLPGVRCQSRACVCQMCGRIVHVDPELKG